MTNSLIAFSITDNRWIHATIYSGVFTQKHEFFDILSDWDKDNATILLLPYNLDTMKEIEIVKDGNMLCARYEDFINLMESPV